MPNYKYYWGYNRYYKNCGEMGEMDIQKNIEDLAATKWASTHRTKHPAGPIMRAMPFYEALKFGIQIGLVR